MFCWTVYIFRRVLNKPGGVATNLEQESVFFGDVTKGLFYFLKSVH